MATRGREFGIFRDSHVKIDIRIDIFIFNKTYAHKILQASTSIKTDSNETNQTDAGDAITSKSRDKLKILYLHYHNGHQT